MNLDGIEPTLTAYQAVILPLNYRFARVIGFEPILIILEIIEANLPTTAFLASISYQVDDIWSFLMNFVIVPGLILLITIKSN